MTPEFYLIIGILLALFAVGLIFGVVFGVKWYVDKTLSVLKKDVAEVQIGMEVNHKMLVDNQARITDLSFKFKTDKSLEPAVKPKPLWEDLKQVTQAIQSLKENPSVEYIPQIPQLASLPPNEAYHALKDRAYELENSI